MEPSYNDLWERAMSIIEGWKVICEKYEDYNKRITTQRQTVGKLLYIFSGIAIVEAFFILYLVITVK